MGQRNGDIDWQNQLSSEISIGADGTLYLCANDEPNIMSSEKSYLYAINPNGKIKWRVANLLFSHAPVSAADGTIYAVREGKLIALLPNGRKSGSMIQLAKNIIIPLE
ncbi:hypothetical protein [Brevibacillus laterosporus]|nr:hypothetical protein [Brevibacillus laterosporus]